MSDSNILYLRIKTKKLLNENEQFKTEHICSQCNNLSYEMYSRAVFKNVKLNFCSRDCVIKWGKVHPI